MRLSALGTTVIPSSDLSPLADRTLEACLLLRRQSRGQRETMVFSASRGRSSRFYSVYKHTENAHDSDSDSDSDTVTTG